MFSIAPRSRAFVAGLAAVSSLALGGALAEQASAATVTYQNSAEDFANPERGFFRQQESLPGSVTNVRTEGLSVVRGIFRLDSYKGTDTLPQSYLSSVDSTFADARNKGVKLVVRFAYNYSGSGTDAPLSRVLRHIEQLGPVLHRNKDVIQVIEAGFVGKWAEWHSSSNNLNSDAAERAIVNAELQHFPQDIKLTLRYPKDKRAIFGTTPVTRAEAHGSAGKARVGYYNDCFLANNNDGATWQSWVSGLMQEEKSFIGAETEYVPMGGETCTLGGLQTQYSNCTNARSELASQGWTVLNAGFYVGILDMWKRDGCYSDISKRLGYRFSLVDASVPDAVSPGAPLKLSFRVRNDGYAAPYNRRPVDVVLRSKATGAVTSIATGADPRFWAAGQTQTVNVDSVVPAGLTQGSYDVLLNLPDPNASLRGRALWSIRLANQNTWESSTGFNALQADVQVGAAAPAPQPEPEVAPAPAPAPTAPTTNPTTPAAPTAPTSPTPAPTSPAAPAPVARPLARDAFARNVSGGFGTADVGGTWRVLSSGASDIWTADGQAHLRTPVGTANERVVALTSTGAKDVDLRVRLTQASVSGSGMVSTFVTARRQKDGKHLRLGVGITGTKIFFRGQTETGTMFADTDSRVAFAPGAYNLRVQVAGSTARMKVWKAGTTEPSAWGIQRTLTAGPTAEGVFGVRTVNYSGASSVVRLDDFSAAPVATASAASRKRGAKVKGKARKARARSAGRKNT